ncbi:MAG: hypothetical protein A2073_03890 [Deltaproteobacteria bacterium GWC2_42_11]|nr:MAG: hypothetical protein A2073_03890 [Deltaproteobacteria bacterium GWC2_42_11]
MKRWIKLHYYKIVRIDDPPDRIARGVAIGVFMGIFPTFGLGIIISIISAYILKANKAAAVLGSFIMNPLTIPFFWTLSSIVGSVIFWENKELLMSNIKNHHFLNGMGWAYIVFLTGNLVVSTAFSAASYFLTRRWIIEHRKHKAMKMLAKRDDIYIQRHK